MRKRLFFFAVLLSLAGISRAYDFSAVCGTGQTLYYNISGSNVIVTSQYNDDHPYSTYPIGSLEIPSSVTYNGTTYTVVSIGYEAFYNCSGLTSVTIPNSVTSIGFRAFSGCSGLTSVTIPNSVTSIRKNAFDGCSGLTSVTIPNSVTTIGGGAFSLCSALTNISVANGNTVYDSRNGCNAIIETATNTLIAGCKNTTIPNSVTSIGDHTFCGCTGLTSITIPNSVTIIGVSAFAGCSGLISVTIPNSVTSIGDHTFCGCTGLTSITIPNSVTIIGEEAFYNCTGLTNVIMLPTTPPTLAEEVFYNTPSSLTIIIPCGTTADYQAAWGNGYNFVESCAILYTVTATANDATMGTVSGGGSYDLGSSITLEATANDGYRFDRWDDGNTDNPRTITVTGDATFIAYFVSTQGIGDMTADGVTLTARDGRITISGADGRQVTLTDALGRIHYRGTATEPLTVGVPAAGIYLLQVDSMPAKRIAVVK